MPRRGRLWPIIVLGVLATPSGEAVGEVVSPSLYVVALPADVSLVAVLPVRHLTDWYDLDLRLAAVLPADCGDKVAGLMKRSIATAADKDNSYDLILERNSLAECKTSPKRISARWTVRMFLRDHAHHPLVVGARTMEVVREAGAVTLDGRGPEGDVPGAPPTARPASFVVGKATRAQVISASLAAPHPRYAAVLELEVSAEWPVRTQPPAGFLARGSVGLKTVFNRFEPLALVYLDALSKPPRDVMRHRLRLVWRDPSGYRLTVGSLVLSGASPSPQ